MKSLVLAILATGLLLDGTNKAIAECHTLAQAKAANPGSPLAYHLVAGAQCWYAGSPRRREPSGAKGSGPAKSANDGRADQPPPRQEARQEADQPPPRQQQVELPTKAEMPEVLSEPSGTVQYRVADTFHVIGADGADVRQPFQTFERQTFERQALGAHAESLERDPAQGLQAQDLQAQGLQMQDLQAQDVQLSWQPSAPVRSDTGNMMAVIRILLVIGIVMIIAGCGALLASVQHRSRLTRMGLLRRHPGQGFNPHW
jgi:hypothetical protein